MNEWKFVRRSLRWICTQNGAHGSSIQTHRRKETKRKKKLKYKIDDDEPNKKHYGQVASKMTKRYK